MGNGKTSDWLIKTGGQILGPFPEKRMIEGIRSREFRPIDEVTRPGGLWRYIRDEPAFAKVVEEVRLGGLSSGDDTTRDTMAGTVSQTINLTATDINDDRTEEISMATVQEALFQSYDDVNKGGRDRRFPGPTQYTYDADPVVKSQAQASTKWIVALTSALIFLTIGYVIFNRFIARPIQSQQELEDTMVAAYSALELGDEQGALDRFRRIYIANPNDRGVHTQLALLEIQVGQQTLQGQRLLQGLASWAWVDKKQIQNTLGLAALKEGDYRLAKIHFDEALAADPLFVQVGVNLGALAIYQKDYPKAVNDLQLAVKDGSHDGIEFLLLTEALVQIWLTEKDRSYLIEARKYVDQGLSFDGPCVEQLLIAGAYLAYLSGESEPALTYFQRFVDRSLQIADRFKRDLLFHRDQVSWTRLSQWCFEAAGKMDPTALVLVAEAKCMARAGDLLGANQKIVQAVEQSPRDPLVQAGYADLLLLMNSPDRAKVSLEKALDFDKSGQFQLPGFLLAEQCLENRDALCAVKTWTNLLKKSPASVVFTTGLAQAFHLDNQIEEARRYLMLAKRISPTYVPALKLQRQMDSRESLKGP